MKRLISPLMLISAVLVVSLFVQPAAYALGQPTAKPGTNARYNRIVGVWDVEVAVASCAGGPAFATFPALHKYELGGTGQVVPATNPSTLSAHVMVWRHLGGNDYLSRFKMYRFDAAGIAIGWVIVSGEVSINKSATEYAGSGVAEFFDNDGNFLFGSCPSFAGTRFTIDE